MYGKGLRSIKCQRNIRCSRRCGWWPSCHPSSLFAGYQSLHDILASVSPTRTTFIASGINPRHDGPTSICQWLRYGWECEPGQDNEMGEEVYGKDIPVSIKKTTEERALFLPLEIIMSRCYNWNWHKGIKQLPKQRKKAMMKMQSGEMERIWVLNDVVSHELNLLCNLPHLGLTATFPNCWSQCSLARSVTWIQRYYNWCELLLCYFSYLSVRLKWAQ